MGSLAAVFVGRGVGQGRTKLLGEIPGLEKFDGKLADPASLQACLELYFRLHSDANLVTLYANLRQSTALSDETTNSMVQRSLASMDELMSAAAFIRREILTLIKRESRCRLCG